MVALQAQLVELQAALWATQLPTSMTVVALVTANTTLAQASRASEGLAVTTHHHIVPSTVNQWAAEPRVYRCEAPLINFDSPLQADLHVIPFLDGF